MRAQFGTQLGLPLRRVRITRFHVRDPGMPQASRVGSGPDRKIRIQKEEEEQNEQMKTLAFNCLEQTYLATTMCLCMLQCEAPSLSIEVNSLGIIRAKFISMPQ